MAFFQIAGLTVRMEPLYAQLTATAQKFLAKPSAQADIIIPYTADDYKKFARAYTSMSLSDAENICTSNFFASAIIPFNGIVLHASALLFEGGAYLFSAASGVGKSTHTRLWQQKYGADKAIILNDDKPALRIFNNTIYACGTPWSGNCAVCENISAPLKGIVFLHRGERNQIKRLEKTAEILPLLLPQTIYKTARQKLSIVLAFTDKLILETPFYKMDCTMSLEAVKIAADAILK